ncbi:MAG: hypothetical protein GY699_07630 [Desulfobacteraceae bacterium]|nr:hypothetical protein [Desulfobacteraceae bacterium]
MVEYKPIIRNKRYVGALILTITSMILFVLVPDYLKNRKLDAKVKTLTQTQDIQIKLRPLYDQISLKADFEKLPGLSVPKKGWFNRSEIRNIPRIFKYLAQKNKLKCLQSRPDVDTLIGNSKIMLISIVLKGEFERFRDFLFDITDLDYLDSMEEIKFVSEQTDKKYTLKIWIAIN